MASATDTIITTEPAGAAPQSPKYYISLTCIHVYKEYMPRFIELTMPAMGQAKTAPGNVVATGMSTPEGLHCTCSAWNSKEDMLQFLRSGAHALAMRESRKIGSHVITYGYESDAIPDWDAALPLLKEKGRLHFDNRPKNVTATTSRSSMPLLVSCAALVAMIAYMATKVVNGSGK